MWIAWAQQTPFMHGFRQMMFSKIVPNLKRLGLLTPRVREAYEKLDLLQFEGLATRPSTPSRWRRPSSIPLLAKLREAAGCLSPDIAPQIVSPRPICGSRAIHPASGVVTPLRNVRAAC